MSNLGPKPSKAALAARRRRVENGERAESEARQRTAAMPTHKQLTLPLLELIQANGGMARPAEIYEPLAERLQLPAELLEEKKTFGDGQSHSLWQRHVRWARQTAVLKGYLAADRRGLWELTEQGRKTLGVIRPGYVVTIFETAEGVALWATAEAAAGVIERASVNLIYVSPPYPLQNPREYGNLRVPEWLDWMKHLGALWRELICDDGSLMVNLGPVFNQGAPIESTYQERFMLTMVDELGWHLAGKHYWYNMNKPASPMPWVVIRRERVRSAVETVYWFSRSKHPKADNRRVLTPYKESTLRRYIGKEGKQEKRRSGYTFGAGSFSRDNGGAIPANMIISPGVASNDEYRRRCREAGLPGHPAAFPNALPEFGIRLTTEEGDLVYDPMAGSGTTAFVAERLGRRWLTSERALDYVRGAALRFEHNPGFAMHLCEGDVR